MVARAAAKDWRIPVLVTTAKVVPLVVVVPIGLGFLAHHRAVLPYLPFAAVLVGAALLVVFARGLGLEARAWVISLPLVALGAYTSFRLGPGSTAGLILALPTLIAALVGGGRVGLAALAVTATVIYFGSTQRPEAAAYLQAGLPLPESWLRALASYVVTTGLFVLLLTRAVRERALADLASRADDTRRAQAQSALLRLSLSQALGHGDFAAAIAEITEVGAQLLDVDRCGVWLLGDEGESLQCEDVFLAKTGTHDRGMFLDAAQFPAYFDALRGQRALAASDARSDPRTRELESVYHQPHGIVSMLDAPVHVGQRMVGVLCHEHMGPEPRVWSHDDEIHAASLADCVARAHEAAERARAEERLKHAYAQLGQLTRRLEAAKEDERRHLARELHDELGQSLTAIKLELQLLAKAGTRVDAGLEIVDRSIKATRELTRGMRPPLLDEIGLIPALQAFVEEQGRASGVAIALAAPAPNGRWAPEIESATFRIVQEAVTNVLRHAEAKHVTVAIRRDADKLDVAVRDDGRGFDVVGALERGAAGQHLGLVGIRERATMLGGTFEVESVLHQGTEVRVRIPEKGGEP